MIKSNCEGRHYANKHTKVRLRGDKIDRNEYIRDTLCIVGIVWIWTREESVVCFR